MRNVINIANIFFRCWSCFFENCTVFKAVLDVREQPWTSSRHAHSKLCMYSQHPKDSFTALFTKPPASRFQPFCDLTGTIPLLHRSNPEAVNGGMASQDGSNQRLFWEWPVTKEQVALWIVLLDVPFPCPSPSPSKFVNDDGLFDIQIGCGTHSVGQCKFDDDGEGMYKWTLNLPY